MNQPTGTRHPSRHTPSGHPPAPDTPDSDTRQHPTPRPDSATPRPDSTRHHGTRPAPAGSDGADGARRVRLTPASAIGMRPVRWLWDERIPAGAITLIPGREGIGKSLALAWLTARLTRGQLPGQYQGQPRPVIYAATEDSWAHTIGPRLHAAGADLDQVYRVDVDRGDGRIGQLTLPADCSALAAEIARLGVVMLAADPLLSLISSHIDSHRDRELRTALEPLAALADQTGCSVAGLAHFSKSDSKDALTLITGSRAFSAVARAVLAVARDPSSGDGTCVLSQAKNNLGRTDLPSLTYIINSADVPTPEGPASVGVLTFTGQTSRHVTDILAEGDGDPDDRAERDEAASWLTHYLTTHGGEAPSRDALKAAQAEGFARRTMQRARHRAGITTHDQDFPRRTIWRLPASPPPAGSAAQWRQSCPPWDAAAPSGTTGNGHAAADTAALFDAVDGVLAGAHPSPPAPVAPQSRHFPRTGTTGATGATGATAPPPAAEARSEMAPALRAAPAPRLEPAPPRLSGPLPAHGAGAISAPVHRSAPSDPGGPGDNRQAIGQARTTPIKEARTS